MPAAKVVVTPAVMVRSSQCGIRASLRNELGKQVLPKLVEALLNCMVPLVLSAAWLNGWLYRVNVKGKVTVMTLSSACEPGTRFVPGTTVAPVDGWYLYSESEPHVGNGVAVRVGVAVAVGHTGTVNMSSLPG